jgi:hypothetical protein
METPGVMKMKVKEEVGRLDAERRRLEEGLEQRHIGYSLGEMSAYTRLLEILEKDRSCRTVGVIASLAKYSR